METKRGARIIDRLRHSKLFKDSFWAVFGNGTGNFLLLVAGILIARLLGRDLYGEYGLIKTTMFQIAAFSTFGLGYTSTKFMAEYAITTPNLLRSVIKSSLKISFAVSLTLCVLLFFFSHRLAVFINAPQLSDAFRVLGVIIVFRSISTTSNGLLAGLKSFRTIGKNAIASGVVMVALCLPLTYYWGLKGSLLTLLLSQLTLCTLNIWAVRKILKNLVEQILAPFTKRLLSFSLPVAMKEFVYMLQAWGSSLLITKYASIGDTALYSVGAQWYAIVMFIPSLLSNVVLSYLSGTLAPANQRVMMRRMILVNFACAAIPFLIVFSLSGFICSFYGPTFVGLQVVLNLFILQTVFGCVNNVLNSALIARGKVWLNFIINSSNSVLILSATFLVLKVTDGKNGVQNIAIVALLIALLQTIVLIISERIQQQTAKER